MSALAVFSPRRLLALIAGDALNIGRDPMLLFATALSLLPAIAFHFGRTPMNDAALAAFGIVEFSRYVAPVALAVPAFLIGWVTGFLLLEDRDEGTLLALDVTPVGKGGFLAYRVAVTALVTLILTLLAAAVVIPEQPWWLIVCIAILVALNAVAAAVVLPALARNKVEGLALTKLTNIAGVVPLLAALPSPWRYLGGIVPTYWIGEVLRLSPDYALPFWLALPIALAVTLAVISGLFRLLASRAG